MTKTGASQGTRGEQQAGAPARPTLRIWISEVTITTHRINQSIWGDAAEVTAQVRDRRFNRAEVTGIDPALWSLTCAPLRPQLQNKVSRRTSASRTLPSFTTVASNMLNGSLFLPTKWISENHHTLPTVVLMFIYIYWERVCFNAICHLLLIHSNYNLFLYIQIIIITNQLGDGSRF